MFTTEIEYLLHKGSVSFTFGEDGLDSYEDTETGLKVEGSGETEAEAVADAIARLPEALTTRLVGLMAWAEECTSWSNDLDYVQSHIRGLAVEGKALKHAVDTFHGTGWEWDGDCHWAKPVTDVPKGRTLWRVSSYPADDDHEVVEEPSPEVLTALQRAA